MSHVFISCSHEDIETARNFAQELKDRGYSIWLYEKRIKGGDDWIPEIDTAIEESDALVLILTRASNRSLYVTYEWGYARGLGKPTIPVKYEEIPKDELHDKLASLNHVPANDWINLIGTLEQKIAASKRYTIRPPRDAHPMILELAKRVDSHERHVRMDAVEQLANISSDLVDELLTQALSSPASDVRADAAQALGRRKTRNKNAVSDLIKLLADDNESVRGAACQSLGALQASEAINPLIELLKPPSDPSYGVCFSAISALAQIGDIKGLPTILSFLADGGFTHIKSAGWDVKSLIKKFGDSSVPVLIASLTEAVNEEFRLWLLDIMMELNIDATVDFLHQVPSSKDESLRRIVVEHFIQDDSDFSSNILRQFLEDDNLELVGQVEKTLENRTATRVRLSRARR